ncbi:MAG: twin-arginine translocation signal domain-containing protein [Acetobacteraceae bacterium]|nr:MAG: twin-arginine translocation signal domain-containing protein [Acetobacteraceae bacterium]
MLIGTGTSGEPRLSRRAFVQDLAVAGAGVTSHRGLAPSSRTVLRG